MEEKSDVDFNPAILAAIRERIERLHTKHHRILLVRLDIRLPVQIDNYDELAISQQFSAFMARLMADKRQQGDCAYVWCREQNISIHPHWHILIIADGNRFLSGYGFLETARRIGHNIWQTSMLGLANLVIPVRSSEYGSGGTMLTTHATANDFDTAFKWVNYIAKNYSKSAPSGYRTWGKSEI
ncbi:MAG: inovirus-type Gp2 protein [Victivallaceae bacterium]|nr:inovirus-type Gp2 protein [Victivallaceae bacterium]